MSTNVRYFIGTDRKPFKKKSKCRKLNFKKKKKYE